MKKIRCCICGKFISLKSTFIHKFTPDSHFTAEKDEYICIRCHIKSKKVSHDNR